MKITVERTEAFAILQHPDGVPVRVWRGAAEDGTELRAYIALIQVPKEADAAAFDEGLTEVAVEIREQPGEPGRFAFASDAEAAPVTKACSALASMCAGLTERFGLQTTLDALVSIYLNRLVRAVGPEHAAAYLESLRGGLPAIAAAQQTEGLGAVEPKGRA